MIEIGQQAKDRITGFKGIVIARTEYLNGCARLAIQPTKLDKDGKPIDAQYFDEPQLESIRPKKKMQRKNDTGGPGIEPPARIVPKRR